MTQVVTISATTAAYAADALKPPTRLRGDGPVDEQSHCFPRAARAGGGPED